MSARPGALRLKRPLDVPKSKRIKKDKKSKKHKKKEKKRVKYIKTDTKKDFVLPEDTRTAAQKRHDEKNAKRELERLREQAKLTHREKVERMNQYLERMPAHNDIPKVGPG